MVIALTEPFDPPSGMRFDPAKVLLDPYGRGAVVPKNYSRDAARLKGDNAATAIKSVVTDPVLTTGRETHRSRRLRPKRSFMKCTCADSPATRVPGSRRKNAAPLPA